MCKDCGCSEDKLKTISVEEKILLHNDSIAAQNSKWLKDKGVIAVNLISSPGSGKTTLLENTLELLEGDLKSAVIVGDQYTDNDAQRLRGKGAKVHQIETYSSCHLNAKQIQDVLDEVIDNDTKLLFIENVGNLICPAVFNLGEKFKIALLSTTEGEDKPVKYPVLFSTADLVILTKTDLLPFLDWNIDFFRENISKIQPNAPLFELSAKNGNNMETWINYLKKVVREN